MILEGNQPETGWVGPGQRSISPAQEARLQLFRQLPDSCRWLLLPGSPAVETGPERSSGGSTLVLSLSADLADDADSMAAIGVRLVKYILHLPGRSAWPRRGARLLVSGFI